MVRRGAGLDKPLLGVPRALTFVHLRQALLNARVNAGTDDALDLHALARKGVSTPQEFTQGFIERGKRVLRDHRVEPRRGRASSVRVLFHARSVGSTRGGLPPGVTRQVTTQGRADGGGKLPTRGTRQIMIQDVAVGAHVVHELGHVVSLLGEHHFEWEAWSRPVIAKCTSSQARTDDPDSGTTALGSAFDSCEQINAHAWECRDRTGVSQPRNSRVLRRTKELGGALRIALRSTIWKPRGNELRPSVSSTGAREHYHLNCPCCSKGSRILVTQA